MPGSYAPMSLTWGYDNRSVAVRIPNGKPAATRIEHRIAGADANPYLVLAAILAAMDEGMARQLPAPAPVVGNAYDRYAPALCGSMRQAVEAFTPAPTSSGAPSGPTYARVYATMKDMECREFERRISMLEYETYLVSAQIVIMYRFIGKTMRLERRRPSSSLSKSPKPRYRDSARATIQEDVPAFE